MCWHRWWSIRFDHRGRRRTRQRGIAVLADTGHQIEVSLRLPVLAETGIIRPGAFVEYQDGSVTRLGIVARPRWSRDARGLANAGSAGLCITSTSSFAN